MHGVWSIHFSIYLSLIVFAVNCPPINDTTVKIKYSKKASSANLYPHMTVATTTCRKGAMDTTVYPFLTTETRVCFNGKWSTKNMFCKRK